MAQLPSIKEQLEKVQKDLEAEQKKWNQSGLGDPGQHWHMGKMQFAFRCEILTIIEILKDKLDLTQDELDLRFKSLILKEMQELFPAYQEEMRKARMAAIVNGVKP